MFTFIWGNNPFKTEAESAANIAFIRAQYINNGIGRWAVIEKLTGNFVGWAGLKLMLETHNGHTNYYDLGYRFIQCHWGKGYATEAAKAVLDYGFRVMGLNEIIGIADIDNTSSIKVLEKAGLIKSGLFDYNGKVHYWMSIEKSDFKF
ncbi:GNAT family N-acetyltransferase [Pedobacter aquatilis]|uniref:GNAT family N-acetyltransferase n=1 Tax=Pedobacter aquatilis TaxID=351343 RepID=UPI002931A3B0|nr:GNAT family N-acetyltransferase [Pedobacter aquatilis]